MASTQSDVRIRDFKARAAALLGDSQAIASEFTHEKDRHILDLGKSLGTATVINRLADLLMNGGLPVSLLQLIDREARDLIAARIAESETLIGPGE